MADSSVLNTLFSFDPVENIEIRPKQGPRIGVFMSIRWLLEELDRELNLLQVPLQHHSRLLLPGLVPTQSTGKLADNPLCWRTGGEQENTIHQTILEGECKGDLRRRCNLRIRPIASSTLESPLPP